MTDQTAFDNYYFNKRALETGGIQPRFNPFSVDQEQTAPKKTDGSNSPKSESDTESSTGTSSNNEVETVYRRFESDPNDQ